MCMYASFDEQVEQLEAENEELGRELAYVGRELQELKAAYAQADRAAGTTAHTCYTSQLLELLLLLMC
jgi:cell division septum initiation protein DivIVA